MSISILILDLITLCPPTSFLVSFTECCCTVIFFPTMKCSQTRFLCMSIPPSPLSMSLIFWQENGRRHCLWGWLPDDYSKSWRRCWYRFVKWSSRICTILLNLWIEGANPSQEEGEEALEDGATQTNNVVHSFRLQKTTFDKKSYLTYLKVR